MKLGSIVSNVKKFEDRRAGFTIRGPAVTASVRGTIVKEECGYNIDTVTAIESVTAVWLTQKGEGSVTELSDNSNSAASISSGRAAPAACSLSQGQSTSGGKFEGQKKPYGYASEKALDLGAFSVNMAVVEAVGGNPYNGRPQYAPAGSSNVSAAGESGIELSVVVGNGQ